MAKRSKHGGRRPGAGRPAGSGRTTGSSESRPVSFRLGADERAELDARGAIRGVSGDVEAKAIVMAALEKMPRVN